MLLSRDFLVGHVSRGFDPHRSPHFRQTLSKPHDHTTIHSLVAALLNPLQYGSRENPHHWGRVLTPRSALSFHVCAPPAGLCGCVDYEGQYRGEVGQYTVRFAYPEALSVTEARRICEGRNEDVQHLRP
jgi:hypothetical protein